jgi:hypothetical protein
MPNDVGAASGLTRKVCLLMTTDSDLFRTRSVDRGGADSTVYLDGIARPRRVDWSLYVLADDREPFTAAQAREFAAMILAAADELDGLR